MDKNFYYCGTFYSNEEDFWEGVRAFDASEVSEKSFEILFEQLVLNLKINLDLQSKGMTNLQFREKCDKIFLLTIANFLDD